MSQSCIFCGSRPVNREHIFSRAWIRELMPSVQPLRHRHIRQGAEGASLHDIWWQKHEADLVVKCVCATCNSGWMSDIDEAAKPLATQMALGVTTVLETVAKQLALARWMTKVAFMFDQTQARPLVDSGDHHGFYETMRPPPSSMIWLGRALPPDGMFSAGGRTHGLRLETGDAAETPTAADAANLYLCTVHINQLLFQVFIARPESPDGIHVDRASEGRFVRTLWPTSFVKVVWPPEGAVPDDKLDAFGDAFITD